MTKDEVLSYLGIKKLPSGVKKSDVKCAALVERFAGNRDYVVANNGGIMVDKKPRSAVKEIVEFYPEVGGKVAEVPEKVVEIETEEIEVEEKEPETVQPPKSVVKKQDEIMSREEMIDYLVKKKMDRKLMEEKSDEDLMRLLKVYKR